MKGFTLIELMVVVLIILILSGGSLTAYLNFNKSESVKNDSRNLTTEINRVRTLAASLQYPTGCSSLKGYNMQSALIDGVLSGVVVTVDCDPENVTFPGVKILGNTYFSAPLDITFLPGSGYLSDVIDQQISIQNIDDSTVTKTITVSTLGVVSNE